MRPALHTCLLLLAAAACEATAATHSLRIVGPAGEATIAYGVNAAGQVAAVLEAEDGKQRGVLFEKGVITELGSLGGAYSEVKGINDSGKIIGSAQSGEGHWRAFVYERAGGMRDLGTLGGPSSYGAGINRSGQAVGYADNVDGDYHAFLYPADGVMRDLGTLGGRSSSAAAINDAGMVVGASELPNRRWHAFVHDGKRMIDIGALIGYGASFATGINSAGHVVGTVLTPDERLSFVWRDGKVTVHRGGQGLHLINAINDGELVIGATYDHRMDAATMPSGAAAVITRGGTEYLWLIGFVVTAGIGMALINRRRTIIIARRGYST